MTPDFVLEKLEGRQYVPGVRGSANINKERNFQQGRKDRQEGQPCRSTNGAYISGWYNLEDDCYYMTRQEIVDPHFQRHCPRCGNPV